MVIVRPRAILPRSSKWDALQLTASRAAKLRIDMDRSPTKYHPDKMGNNMEQYDIILYVLIYCRVYHSMRDHKGSLTQCEISPPLQGSQMNRSHVIQN